MSILKFIDNIDKGIYKKKTESTGVIKSYTYFILAYKCDLRKSEASYGWIFISNVQGPFTLEVDSGRQARVAYLCYKVTWDLLMAASGDSASKQVHTWEHLVPLPSS